MPLFIPPELKKISPYIRRAEELDRDPNPESRLVAYYLRQYAVLQGIPLAADSPAAKTCLGDVLGELEKEKPAMDNFTVAEAAYVCRSFAYKVFDRADIEDREGRASKDTAKAFYAAASFLQILEQFADKNATDEATLKQQEDDRKKVIYCKWKATEILKAIKEGRQPTPGGYGEEQDDEEEKPAKGSEDEAEKKDDAPPAVETVEGQEAEADEDMALPPPASTMLPPPMEPFKPPYGSEEEDEEDETPPGEGTEVELGPPPAYPGDDEVHPAPPSVDRPKLTFDLPPPEPPKAPVVAPKPKPARTGLFGLGAGGGGGNTKRKPTKAQIADAEELTRFALAALEDKNADLGAERLEQALKALGRR
jgi:vacuolar protein sorting-associated protein VTA1